MLLPVHEILGLFRIRGAATYGGEAVSQLDHALQCAQLAEEAGSTPELVAASLLHDLGHLLVERPHEIGRAANDLHQFHPLPFLRGAFPDAVREHIVHRRSGLLARFDDPIAFTAEAVRLALQPARIEPLRREARRIAERLRWDDVMRDFAAVLADVIAQHSHGVALATAA